MLPLLTHFTKELNQFLLEVANQEAENSIRAIAETPKFVCHEGDKHKGHEMEARPFKLFEESVVQGKQQWKLLDFGGLLEKYRDLGRRFAQRQLEQLISELRKAEAEGRIPTREIGQRSLAQDLLDILEHSHVSFDKHGQVIPLHFIGTQEGNDKYSEAIAEILGDPELLRRNNQILAKKREEWRAREANRKLVD